MAKKQFRILFPRIDQRIAIVARALKMQDEFDVALFATEAFIGEKTNIEQLVDMANAAENLAGLIVFPAQYLTPDKVFGETEDHTALELEKIVRKEGINVVMPLKEHDAILLAEYARLLKPKNVAVLAPPYKQAWSCTDKYLANQCMRKSKIPTPAAKLIEINLSQAGYIDTEFAFAITRLKGFPLLLKILRGGGSGGIVPVRDYEQLYYQLRVAKDEGVDKVLLQKYIPGRVYSVDILSDLQGRAVAAVPKLILDTNGSVALSAQLQPYPEIEDLAKKTADAFRLRGLSNLDIIEGQDGKLYVIDINPRISGSLDLLLEANINLVYGLLQIIAGRDSREIHFDIPNGIASENAFHPYSTERIENMIITDEKLEELKTYEGKIVIVNDERVLLKSVLPDRFIYMKVNVKFTEDEMDRTDPRWKGLRYEDIRKDIEYVHIETSPYQNMIVRDLSKRIIFSSIGGERKVEKENLEPGEIRFNKFYREIRKAEAKVKE